MTNNDKPAADSEARNLAPEVIEAVVDEYLHWREVNRHIKGGENYLKRLRDARAQQPTPARKTTEYQFIGA